MNNNVNLVKNYGIMILRKNTILYHTSNKKTLISTNDKFF